MFLIEILGQEGLEFGVINKVRFMEGLEVVDG